MANRRIKDKLNAKQVKFAILVASGKPILDAYQDAGYSNKSRPCAYGLLDHPEIKRVIKEEQNKMASDISFMTKDWILEQYRAIMDKTTFDSVKIKALDRIAKLLGYEEDTLNIKTDTPLFEILPYDAEQDKTYTKTIQPNTQS